MLEETGIPQGLVDRLAYWLLRGLTLVCDAVGVLLLAGILLLIVAAVIARDFIGLGMPWTEEVASLLAIYAVGIGSLSALVRGEHLLVDLFSHRMSRLALDIQYRLNALLSCGFFALAAWGAWVMSEMSANNRTVSLGISFSYLYYGIFIGFAGMTLIAAWQTLRGRVAWVPGGSRDDEESR
ncbi:TRAP transporter small permease [Halomonas sp. MA07-2]|uniref:TRAP transporter small permease n=1 Tax=Halomonas sp. MA07-2 TaxID=3440841 RepID=UPI003EEDD3C3